MYSIYRIAGAVFVGIALWLFWIFQDIAAVAIITELWYLKAGAFLGCVFFTLAGGICLLVAKED